MRKDDRSSRYAVSSCACREPAPSTLLTVTLSTTSALTAGLPCDVARVVAVAIVPAAMPVGTVICTVTVMVALRARTGVVTGSTVAVQPLGNPLRFRMNRSGALPVLVKVCVKVTVAPGLALALSGVGAKLRLRIVVTVTVAVVLAVLSGAGGVWPPLRAIARTSTGVSPPSAVAGTPTCRV